MVGIGGELLTGRRTFLDPMNGIIGLRGGRGGAEEYGTSADDCCNDPLAFHNCPFRTAARILRGNPPNCGGRTQERTLRSLRKMGRVPLEIVSHVAGEGARVRKGGTPPMRHSCTMGQFPQKAVLYQRAIAGRAPGIYS